MSNSSDIAELIAISRFAGERFDLVQAGGGNSSMKTSDGLFVKASGLALSDLRTYSDFCCVDWVNLASYISRLDEKVDSRHLEKEGTARVQASLRSSSGKPSIETLMHCLMNRLTLHTHPVATAAIVCRPNYKKLLSELFKDAICVDYHTPGAALAVAIDRQLSQYEWQAGQTAVVFLQNHGLLVSAQTADEVIAITESVNDKLANHLSLNLDRYKLAPKIAALVNRVAGTDFFGYLSEDKLLSNLACGSPDVLMSAPATPDQLVYCGPVGFVWSQNENANINALKLFLDRYGQPPRVIKVALGYTVYVILLGTNLRKCRDIEDVLKAHCLTLSGMQEEATLLPQSEISFISNWDAEKYRQQL
jgi:rhamnose utilization protein RhaD (predicted bifunctional aldolase and dehydrogenase)